jgi:hypothetical protein
MDNIKDLKGKLSFAMSVQKNYKDEGMKYFVRAEKCFEERKRWLLEVKKLRKMIKKHDRSKKSCLQKLSGVMRR